MTDKTDTSTKVLATIGILSLGFPFLLAMIVLVTMWHAWWLYPAWGWLLVPLGAPPVSFWHFAALLLLVRAATQEVSTKKDDRKTEWGSVVLAILWPAIVWMLLKWMAA